MEFHLEAEYDTPRTRKTSYPHRDTRLGVSELQDQIIIGGDQVATAQASFDESGLPQVNITLDGAGGLGCIVLQGEYREETRCLVC
ncbi:MAG: hypothetical protein Ct9H300mP20_06960 [Gammaproteobacteria bacterium]|nr:MAG: hypothetical protein Ct9H300mP20_06960 [Gammaproteobacteria bacterium]